MRGSEGLQDFYCIRRPVLKRKTTGSCGYGKHWIAPEQTRNVCTQGPRPALGRDLK